LSHKGIRGGEVDEKTGQEGCQKIKGREGSKIARRRGQGRRVEKARQEKNRQDCGEAGQKNRQENRQKSFKESGCEKDCREQISQKTGE
jgi:hypothetical protein